MLLVLTLVPLLLILLVHSVLLALVNVALALMDYLLQLVNLVGQFCNLLLDIIQVYLKSLIVDFLVQNVVNFLNCLLALIDVFIAVRACLKVLSLDGLEIVVVNY